MVSEALPLIATLAVSDPEVFGAKVTVRLTLCPARIVAGKTTPLMLKALLSTEAFDSVMLVPPEFFKVAAFATLCPTATVPKARDVGLTSRAPAPTAFPVSASASVPAVAALVEMTSLPAGLPAACGVKATVSAALCPAARLKGIAGATTWKEGSDDVALAIVTVVDELLVRVSVSCLDAPITAVPKSRLAAAAATEPLVMVEERPLESARQPVIIALAKKMERTAVRRSQRELRPMSGPFQAALAFVRRENLEFAFVAGSWREPSRLSSAAILQRKIAAKQIPLVQDEVWRRVRCQPDCKNVANCNVSQNLTCAP